MIKRYWEITVRDYDIMEQTGNISQFKKWYNPFPVKLFLSQIKKELKTLIEKIDGQDDTDNIKWEVQSLIKINKLRAVLTGILAISMYSSYEPLLKHLSVSKRLRAKKHLPKFEFYALKAKELTGIDITTEKGFQSFREKVEFRIDKHKENFKKPQGEKTRLMPIVLGVIAVLNMNYDPHMTVLEFSEVKKRAEQEINKRNGRS